jgi:TatD DNase family protein
MEFIDIGINLAHDSYDADRDETLARAAAVGVSRMIVTGSSRDSTRKAIDLARAHAGKLFATSGMHPHHATDLTAEALAGLEADAREPEVVAVGECGLDYFRDFSPREAQRQAFHAQLEVATRVGKPVFLHQRDAHEDFLAILKEHRITRGVAHCFTAGEVERDAYLAQGLHIGITGWICDERRGKHLREVVRAIPANRLMIETDGPYLLPRDLKPQPKSRRNEPAFLPHIAKVIADARNEPLAEFATTTAKTTRDFFQI